jgi:hypothetical protein
LVPGTYTAQATQSDAAGNTGLSSPSTFTVAAPPPPPRAPVIRYTGAKSATIDRHGGVTLPGVTIVCGAGGTGCNASATLMARIVIRGRRGKPNTARVVKLGSTSFKVPAGQSARMVVLLSATMQRLLAQHGPLAVTADIVARNTSSGQTARLDMSFRLNRGRTTRLR